MFREDLDNFKKYANKDHGLLFRVLIANEVDEQSEAFKDLCGINLNEKDYELFCGSCYDLYLESEWSVQKTVETLFHVIAHFCTLEDLRTDPRKIIDMAYKLDSWD